MNKEQLLEKLKRINDEKVRVRQVRTKNGKDFYVVELVKTIWLSKDYLKAISETDFVKGTDYKNDQNPF